MGNVCHKVELWGSGMPGKIWDSQQVEGFIIRSGVAFSAMKRANALISKIMRTWLIQLVSVTQKILLKTYRHPIAHSYISQFFVQSLTCFTKMAAFKIYKTFCHLPHQEKYQQKTLGGQELVAGHAWRHHVQKWKPANHSHSRCSSDPSQRSETQ